MPAVNEQPSFRVQSVTCAHRRMLVLSGEIDMAAAPAIEDAIRRTCATDGTSEIVLDLRKVTFMDSTGVRLSILAREACERSGYGFSIIPGSRQVRRVFEIAGLGHVFETSLPTMMRVSRSILSLGEGGARSQAAGL
jgi:anti-sigma B factor antagonist